ncbi:DUF4199 domain-containing protein [Aliikangiella sp. IMCC44359]|uniref:DUF4199 domain-containing protein n=1 Tax=Aliikangiella sp. IMCC44359 TaxID=3459125 RepID=UPI00403ABB22
MQKNILKYGLISGSVIVMIPVIAGLVMGYGPETFKMGEIIGYSTMVLSLLMIFLAVREYQVSYPDEVLGFGKVLLIGCGISAIAGIMFGIYNVIYVTWISPEFMDLYYQYYIDNIKSSGASEVEIQQQIAQLEADKQMFMNLWVNFFLMFITVFIIGFIVSVVSGVFQSKKQASIS